MTRGGAELVGRSAELDALRSFVDDVRAGNGSAVVVEGEAGIGKSALVSGALTMADQASLPVLVGAGRELSADLPFSPLVEALGLDGRPTDTARSRLRALLIQERTAEEATYRLRAVHATCETIEGLAEGTGLLVVLDDLHWCDEGTLQVIERLSLRLAHTPVGLLIATRPLPRTPALEAALAALVGHGAVSIRLAPLPADDVALLVRDLVGAEPGPGLLGSVEGASGNPLFVNELVSALDQEGLIDVSEGRADTESVGAPPSLALTILRRLSFLSTEALETLRVASVLGSQFDVRDLSIVTGRPAIALLGTLEEALRADLLGDAGARLAFRHELIRESIYQDIPPSIRTALHADAAQALLDAGQTPSSVATHLVRGTSEADPRAVDALRRAAEEVAAAGSGMAVEMLERALALTPVDAPERDDLRADLARALVWAGRWSEGEDLARSLFEDGKPGRGDRDVRVALVQARFAQGSNDPWLADMIETAARDETDDEHHRATLLAIAALTVGQMQGADACRALLDEAYEVAERTGNEPALCLALTGSALLAWHDGFASDGVVAARRAVDLYRRLGGRIPLPIHDPLLSLALNLIQLEQYEEGIEVFEEAVARAEEANNIWALAMAHRMLGFSRFQLGLWDDAVAEFSTALRLWGEAQSRWTIGDQAWLARISAHRDDMETARHWLEEAERGLPHTDYRMVNLPAVRLARALLEEAHGDPTAAFRALEEARRSISETGAAMLNTRIGPDHVRLALAAGERDAAEEMTAATEEVARRLGTRSARGQALRCRGVLTSDPETILAAVDAHREGMSVVERAGALVEAGQILGAQDANDDAIKLLEEAVDLWEGAGAVREVGRAEALLRDLGVRRGKRGPRGRPATGWDSLTEAQGRVVDLVSEGLTYREIGERLFISRRTVETHVSHVFAKLGVSSRAELAAAVLRLSSTADR